MDRTRAAELIEQYVDRWTRQDVGKVLAPLSADPVIVECDGTMFSGRDAVNRWFTDWHAAPPMVESSSGRFWDSSSTKRAVWPPLSGDSGAAATER